MAGASKEDMEMCGLDWGDIVVAKLNILELSSICICRFKEEAHPTIAFLISQDFLADILVGEFLALATLNKFHSVVRDVDLGHICLIAFSIVGLVLIFGHLASQFSLVIKDLIEGPILKERIDRLPVASIVTQGAVLDICILKVTIVNCLGIFFLLWLDFWSFLVCGLLESLEVFLHHGDIVLTSLGCFFCQTF